MSGFILVAVREMGSSLDLGVSVFRGRFYGPIKFSFSILEWLSEVTDVFRLAS